MIVNLNDHMIVVIILVMLIIMIILIITQPHLPLLSHDLPQLLRAQCSGAILVQNLQQSYLSYYLAKKLF